jgi:hypothetical protein
MFSKTKVVTNTIFVLIMSLLIAGCASARNNVENISKSYRENHDYESLVALLPYLNYTMTRADVENLLGTSVLCPVVESCTYFSSKSVIVQCPVDAPVSASTCQRFSLALVVRYELAVKEGTASPQDRLANFSLSPVGE